MSLATIHMGKRALGLDDETYRALLFRLTGKQSARDLNFSEQCLVVREMQACGFKPKGKRLDGKYAKKLQALWIAGWNLGIIRDRSDKALLAFVKRQTGIDHIRFLRDGDDASKAIEALKGWLQREGGVDWSGKKIQDSLGKRLGGKRLGGKRLGGKRLGGKRLGGKRLGGKRLGGKRLGGKRPGYLILRAQWKRLHPNAVFDPVSDLEAFDQSVLAVSGKAFSEMGARDFCQVMNVWGRKIRKGVKSEG